MPPAQANLRRSAITRWVIYILVALAVVLPYVTKLTFPGKPGHWAERVYDAVDGLRPGSRVLMAFDYDPSAKAELHPMSMALLRHCFQKHLVPIVMTHWNTGIGLAKDICEKAAEDANRSGRPVQSGRDYVYLGYRPGMSNLVLNMGENLKAAFGKDYYGQSTQAMPALEGVSSLKDIDLAIDLAAGNTVEMWIAYGSDRFHFPLAVGTTAVIAPDLYPWLQSGQLIGFLGGLRGAADYETLLNAPGDATGSMPSQSAAHVLIVLLIIGANVRLVVGRFRRRKG